MGKAKHLSAGYIIYTVGLNKIRMMQKRGYSIDEEDKMLLGLEMEDYMEYFTKKMETEKVDFFLGMNKLYTRIIDENGDPATEGTIEENYVYFVPMGDEKSICVDKITPLADIIFRGNMKYVDVISHAPLHAWSNTILGRIKNKKITTWVYEEMMAFPFDSLLVPDYHVMTRKEIQEAFYDEKGKPYIQRSKMSGMTEGDPIAKFLRLSVNNIIMFVEEQSFVPSLVPSRLRMLRIVPGNIADSSKRATTDVSS